MFKITPKAVDKEMRIGRFVKYLAWEVNRINCLKTRKQNKTGQVYMLRKSTQGGIR
jgi:hypothetical protein